MPRKKPRTSPGPARRLRRRQWQRDRRRRRSRLIAGAAAAGAGLLLALVGAVSAGPAGAVLAEARAGAAARWEQLLDAVDHWLADAARQPPPVAVTHPLPKAPEPAPAAAAPAPPKAPAPPARLAALPMPPPSPAPPEPPRPAPPTPAAIVAPPPGAIAAPPLAATGNLPAWRRYAVAAVVPDGPAVAVIIDDLGLHEARTRQTIGLPRPLTLSFLPYGQHAAGLAEEARAAGHEIMLHLPMQPDDMDSDPGPQALRVDLSPDELARRLTWDLDRLQGYVGVNNHMGSLFTRSPEGMATVMRALAGRGLLFVDSMTTHLSVGRAVARAHGVPMLARDVFLDNLRDRTSIEAQLALLEAIAVRKGQAIGIGHPYPETLAALQAWLPGLAGRGVHLVPVSALMRRQMAG